MSAADCEKLEARKQTLLGEIAELATKADYSVDGQSVSNSAKAESMLKQLEQLNIAIAICGGPIEVVTQGR